MPKVDLPAQEKRMDDFSIKVRAARIYEVQLERSARRDRLNQLAVDPAHSV